MSSELDIWPPKQNYMTPACMHRWQRELIDIAGLSPTGLPILRLEWGSTTTWTSRNRDLKYLQRKQERTIAWGVNVHNASGGVIKTLRFSLDAKNIPQPDKIYGLAYPINIEEEIG